MVICPRVPENEAIVKPPDGLPSQSAQISGMLARMTRNTSPVSAAVTLHGLTHAQVAKIIGTSRQRATDRMNGTTRWTVADVTALSDHLGVPVDALVRPQ